jgi:hypothetical protein
MVRPCSYRLAYMGKLNLQGPRRKPPFYPVPTKLRYFPLGIWEIANEAARLHRRAYGHGGNAV